MDQDNFINVIERSLLTDLTGLYRSDLLTERHRPGHFKCIACAKQAIIVAILRYENLDAQAKRQTLRRP